MDEETEPLGGELMARFRTAQSGQGPDCNPGHFLRTLVLGRQYVTSHGRWPNCPVLSHRCFEVGEDWCMELEDKG